jgi:hypothetical protein
VTLLDYAQAPSPFFVDSTKFTDVKNSVIWTTSPVRPVTAKPADQSYWVVDFGSGVVKPLLGISDARVLCVAAK